MSDIKITFKGKELNKFGENDVLCFGCLRTVARSDAEFCLWGGAYCHFCHRCLEILTKAQKEGRTVTKQELMEAKS